MGTAPDIKNFYAWSMNMNGKKEGAIPCKG